MVVMVFVYGIGYTMRGLHISRGLRGLGVDLRIVSSYSSLGLDVEEALSSALGFASSSSSSSSSSYLMAVRERAIPMVVHVVVGAGGGSEDGGLVSGLKAGNPGWEVRTYQVGEMDRYVDKWYGGAGGSRWVGLWQKDAEEHGGMYAGLYAESSNKDEWRERREHRLNLFRYLVLAKFGGVVYDVGNVSSPVPSFGELIYPDDRFVGVWDVPYQTAKDAIGACRVRQRSVRHDVFAATANHPVLIEVLGRMMSMRAEGVASSNENERSGEGVLTDVVVDYALKGKGAAADGHVRLLAASAFGSSSGCVRDISDGGVDLALLERIAQRDAKHGLLPVSVSVPAAASSLSTSLSSPFAFAPRSTSLSSPSSSLSSSPSLSASSSSFAPTSRSFDVMVSNDDVSASLMTRAELHGVTGDGPSLAELLLRSLALANPKTNSKTNPKTNSKTNPATNTGVVVDVGAGYGLVSLAAASEGHRVVAFELGPKPLEAFKESIDRNDLGGLISVQEMALGSTTQDGDDVCLRGRPAEQAGYGVVTAEDAASESSNCIRTSTRRAGHLVFGDERIAALRVSASGWDGHVIEGFLPLLQPDRVHRPQLISLEWNIELFERAMYTKPLKLVETLYELGYHSVSHRGPICDERWNSLGQYRDYYYTAIDQMRRPVWCKVDFEDFRVLTTTTTKTRTRTRTDRDGPTPTETLLFLLPSAGVVV